MSKLTRKLVAFGRNSKWNLPVAMLGIVLLYAFACIADNVQIIRCKLHGGAGQRLVAMTLSVCMVVSMLPTTVFATEGSNITSGTPKVCESHTAHDEDCGYIVAVEAIPATAEVLCEPACEGDHRGMWLSSRYRRSPCNLGRRLHPHL